MSFDPGLERAHSALTEAFPREGDFELSDSQLADFERDGFLTGLRILNDEQLVALRERLELMRERMHALQSELHEVEVAWLERPDEAVLHFLGAWRVDELFHDLVFAPAVTSPLAQALGTRRLRFWHDQVFYKPPQHKGVVPWHQDYSYWTRATPACHITMNIVLDDADEESGCLHFVPGSQRWPLLPMAAFGGDMNQLEAHLTDEQRAQFQPVAATGKAGTATIHHSHTVHGSYGNASTHPRRAVVLNFMGENVCAATQEPLLRGIPPVAQGARIEGDFFPITYDRGA